MNAKALLARRAIANLVLVGLVLLIGNVALAAPFQLTYNGVFGTTDSISPEGGPITSFASPTPFTLTATFDTASTNYVSFLPPFLQSGWVSYSPISAMLSAGGQVYSVDNFASNPASGIAVAIFDQNTIFEPGFYGVGFIQDPVADVQGSWAILRALTRTSQPPTWFPQRSQRIEAPDSAPVSTIRLALDRS